MRKGAAGSSPGALVSTGRSGTAPMIRVGGLGLMVVTMRFLLGFRHGGARS
jgi:hypothetical protein